MEAFQLLSSGGVKFNKTKYEKDVRLFTKNKLTTKKRSLSNPSPDEIPAELDFFKYARNSTGKRKHIDSSSDRPRDKKRRFDEDKDDTDQETEGPEPQGTEKPQMKHKVTSRGNNIPEAIETFDHLRNEHQIPSQLLQNLPKNGYNHPTSIQSHAIPIILGSRDLAAISPTGTGKTLSYLFPIMTALQAPISSMKGEVGFGVRALVIAPTRELAHQIHNECLKLVQGRKWRTILFSKATASTLADKNVRDKVDIIISTPLRLVASLRAETFDLRNVRHLVLDEADRLLDAEFLSQVQEIVAACTHPNIQKAVFSATLPAGAEKIAMEMLRDPIRVVVGLKDTPLPLIQQSLTYVADDQSKLPSLLTSFAKPYNPPVLVFTSTQPRASSLAEELTLNGIQNVDCLHAGMTKKERDDAVSRMRQGQSWILISTEVMARGMDFKGVREVINYDFPTSVQSYIHRIGRTGRAGQEGKAVTFFTDEDAPFLKSIANVILQSGQTMPDWIIKLPKPSKMKRKAMGKVKRPEMVNNARKIGRQDAIRKRDMIAGSKRREAKQAAEKKQKSPMMDADNSS
ncbi:P-loop containing nucleoside triphosphate hydrolase protein [Macrolepiota fuliginosa MF-IS2]|uniref:RNA helicase n=1 Tax=Macrolepiota fuliginosa MF-IS2 TaxID=1400762 RepID=A0A9P5XQP6_9AGAR|nr:P-loop containing nucleoside triphosphate hydrolase protein [Macrolepiota fuliginosa MF-IS2]